MKKIIASLVLAIIALFSFGCTDKLPEEELPEKEMPYNVLYDAKFVDKSERYMTEEFINELGYAGDFHDDRMLIIDNKTEFNRVYKSFPYEIDFAKDILAFCLTLLLPIIFSNNYIASAENCLKNVDNVPFLTV